MRVSYQNANLRRGNESTLLRFTDGETRACILADSGEGVDLDALLAPDEYLNAILLTHAHIDHYRTLASNVRHNAPIYASPATATVLDRSLPEAQKDNDLGDVSAALDAVEPIDDWTAILDWLEVRPVPAGHTPGAAGFLIRFRDDDVSTDTDLPTGDQHILVTGDFTTRPCAGFPPLARSYPADVDAALLNVSTNDSCVESLNESVRTILERAYAGSRVVVAASSLTGVHYAVLLARLATELDRSLPITVVGQTATIYDALGFDAVGVESREVFEHPTEVLEQGTVTVAGPDDPTRGSTERLLGEIHDDSADVFVQIAAGATAVTDATCTTHYFEASNHPPPDAIDELVRDLAPMEVVLKHASGRTLSDLQRRYDRCFTWGTVDEQIHVLYEDGEWRAPEWIGDATARQIRQKRWKALQERSIAPADDVPSLDRRRVDPSAEGVDVAALESSFSTSPASPYDEPTADADVADGTMPGDSGSDSFETEGDSDGGSFEADVLARLDEIESKLDGSSKTVRARVLSGGDGETFLRLLERTELRPGRVVEVSITPPEDDDTG